MSDRHGDGERRGDWDPVADLVRRAAQQLEQGGGDAGSGASDGDVSEVAGWEPIDLLLEQGAPADLARMRGEVAADPLRALELAETVQFVEACRELEVAPSAHFAGKMQSVVAQAERQARHRGRPRVPRWQPTILYGLAAAASFWLLCALDAGGATSAASTMVELAVLSSDSPSERPRADRDAASARADVPAVTIEAEDIGWQRAVHQIQRRLQVEESGHLAEAFARGLRGDRADLGKWLEPANALTMIQLGHELRGSAELRAAALRAQGLLPEVDRRVQALAGEVAADLAVRPLALDEASIEGSLDDVAWGTRALIGAGSGAGRSVAIERSADWLTQVMGRAHDARLVVALSGLVEVAAVTGQSFDDVAAHGARLVDEVLAVDAENWRRRRPALLGVGVSPLVLGEAGRVLSSLPAFGVDADRCTLVRRLCLGRLREQRAAGQDRPEVLAAMTYGYADLLDQDAGERDRLSWALQRWKPARLAPDFATVQQMAWSLAPGTRGHTRMQRELRQLSILPAPLELRDRAAFCLCLATHFAGFLPGTTSQGRPVRGS